MIVWKGRSDIEEIKFWNFEKDKKLFHWKYASTASIHFLQILRDLRLNGNRSFHTLRHTYASHLLMSGVNILVVNRWLGHCSVKVTEKHYGHLIPDTVKVDLHWESIE